MASGVKKWLGSVYSIALACGLCVEEVRGSDNYEELAEMSLQDLVNMDVFTSSANLVPTETRKAPGTVYRFDQQDFSRFGVRRLDDLLQYIPGFQVSQYRKRHRSVWSRGMLQRYNDKMMLLVDGVRQQHFYYGHFSLGDNFPLEQIESVEIIQGPASSLYGANALSGLISITTRDFTPLPELKLTAEVANNERSKVSGLYSSERLQVFASYLDQEAPFSDDRKSFIGSPVLQPLDEDFQNFYIKARPVGGLTLKLEYNRSETPFLFIPATQDAFVETEFWSVAAAYEMGDFETGRIEVDGYYQSDKGREYEREQVTQRPGYEEFQDAVMAGFNVTGFKRYGDHTLALGGSWRQDRAKETRFERRFHFRDGFLATPETGDLLSEPGVVNEDHAVFLQDVWAVSKNLNVTLGTRYDKFDRFGDYVNYRVAAVYSAEPEHTWKFLYGTGIRPPSAREYLKVLQGTTFKAPVPDAEVMKSFELSYAYEGNRLSSNTTFYHNRVDDFIVEMPTPDGADEYFANSYSSVDVVGIESSFDYRVNEQLDLRLTASYVDISVSAINDIPYVSSWMGSLLARYRLSESLSAGMTLVYNDNRDDLNLKPEDDAESFVSANVFIEGRLSANVRYRAGVDNLFDQEIMDPAADFGPQYNTERSLREVWLSVSWSPDL